MKEEIFLKLRFVNLIASGILFFIALYFVYAAISTDEIIPSLILAVGFLFLSLHSMRYMLRPDL